MTGSSRRPQHPYPIPFKKPEKGPVLRAREGMEGAGGGKGHGAHSDQAGCRGWGLRQVGPHTRASDR